MRIFKTSITAEIFYLTMTAVLITSAVSSFYVANNVAKNIKASTSSEALSEAELIAASLEETLNHFSILAKDLIHGANYTPADLNKITSQMVQIHSEILSLSIFYNRNGNILTSLQQLASLQPRAAPESLQKFEDRSINLVELQSLELARQSVEVYHRTPRSSSVQIQNISPILGLPIMLVTYRFAVESLPGQFVYVSFALWQSSILNKISKDRNTKTAVWTKSGSSVLSTNPKTTTTSKHHFFTRKSLKAYSPSRSGAYSDPDRKQTLGAYAYLPSYRNYVVTVDKNYDTLVAAPLKDIYEGLILRTVCLILVALLASVAAATPFRKALQDLLEMSRHVAAGDLAKRVRPQTYDEMAELGHSMNQMVSSLTNFVNTHTYEVHATRDRLTSQILQSRIYSNFKTDHGYLSHAAVYLPFTRCGSDIWFCRQVSANKSLYILAEVAADPHMAPIAQGLVYTTLEALVHSALTQNPAVPLTPSILLTQVNDLFEGSYGGDLKVGAVAVLFDRESGTMVYAHVGHAAPLVRASLENPAKTDAPPLASRIYGLCAGSYSHTSASPVASYLEDISIELNPGDKVILYSKGYLNNEHPNQNPSHSPKIEACLAETFDKSTQATADHLVKDFQIPSTPQWQDVTIIVVAIDRSWGQRRANLNQSV